MAYSIQDMGLQLERDEAGERFPAYVTVVHFTCDRCGETTGGRDSVDQCLLIVLDDEKGLLVATEGAHLFLQDSARRMVLLLEASHRGKWWNVIKRFKCWWKGLWR